MIPNAPLDHVLLMHRIRADAMLRREEMKMGNTEEGYNMLDEYYKEQYKKQREEEVSQSYVLASALIEELSDDTLCAIVALQLEGMLECGEDLSDYAEEREMDHEKALTYCLDLFLPPHLQKKRSMVS